MTEREKPPKQRKEKRGEDENPTIVQSSVDLLWANDAAAAGAPDPAPSWDCGFDAATPAGEAVEASSEKRPPVSREDSQMGPPRAPAPTRLDLSGPVSDLSGSCPTLTFAVRGYRVDTNDDTKFTKGPCKRITDGISLDIVGERRPSGAVYAVRIELEKD